MKSLSILPLWNIYKKNITTYQKCHRPVDVVDDDDDPTTRDDLLHVLPVLQK